MESLQTILLVAQVLIAISLIGLILIQHGKGADAGAAFGSGASSTVFGSQGSGNFLTKATAILAFLFLANSLSLAFIASKRMTAQESLMIGSEVQIEQAVQQASDDMEMEVPTVDMDMSEMMQDDIPQIPAAAEDMPTIPAESDIPALPTE